MSRSAHNDESKGPAPAVGQRLFRRIQGPERKIENLINMRIILIDDHNLFRAGIKSLLASQLGLSVVAEASSAEEGLDAMRRYRCDLVVLDYNLPDRDGVWLVEEIRKVYPRLPILVLSHGAGTASTFL